MSNHILENGKNIENNFGLQTKEQKKFLETTLGKTINIGLDLGIRALLPNLVEDAVIEIKNILLENGVKSGAKKAVDTVIDFGKSTMGLITGKFENLEQIQIAVKKGGIIDTISNGVDFALKKTEGRGILNKDITSILKQGKNVILDNISKNIENEFNKQVLGIEKLNKYIKKWNENFLCKNIEGMNQEFSKISKSLKELIPLENTIKEARKIENIHSLLKQKNGQFDFDEIELELAGKLIG